jgi:hypothetical protein
MSFTISSLDCTYPLFLVFFNRSLLKTAATFFKQKLFSCSFNGMGNSECKVEIDKAFNCSVHLSFQVHSVHSVYLSFQVHSVDSVDLSF